MAMTEGPTTATKPNIRLHGRGGRRGGALWAVVLGAAVLLSLAPSPAVAQLNNGPPKEVEGVTVQQRLGERLPLDLPLVDSLGRQTTLGDMFDARRPVLVTLNYSNCPVLCSTQLNKLTETLKQVDLRLGDEFRVLTVSIDPNESTQRIRQTKENYVEPLLAEQPAAEQGWQFATASQASITRLTEALGFQYRYDEQTGQYYHPAMLAFISPEGVITRYSLALDFPPDQMKLALLEAADGTIGSPVDQFVLWCFSYDSSRGSYVPEAWRLMRLGAALTVFVLIATITPYWFGRMRSAGALKSTADDATAVDDHPTDSD